MIDALVCVRPGELAIEQRPEPRPAAGEILVRPRRIGICGTDYHIFEGNQPFLSYPRVMGHELAVEVVEAPAGSELAPGEICTVIPYLSCGECHACRRGKPNCCQRIAVLGVHRDGGMTSLLALPSTSLVPAHGLSVDECAAVEFLAIGAHAVGRAGAIAGENVLVVGAGPIGLGVALFAAIAGARVSVMDRDLERLKVAAALAGATPLAPGKDAKRAVSETTGGDGFDAVFDATGNALAMQASLDYVANGGRCVFVGVIKGPIAFEDSDFHRREATLLASRNATAADFDHVMAAMRAGSVPVEGIITHRTSLEEGARHIPVWAAQKRGLIKALISID